MLKFFILLFFAHFSVLAEDNCKTYYQSYRELVSVEDAQSFALLTEKQIKIVKSRRLNPNEFKFIGEGTEGLVLYNSNKKTLLKIYFSEFYFNKWKEIHDLMSSLLKQSGYQYFEPIQVNLSQYYVEREYVSGITLSHFSELYLHKNKLLWGEAFSAYSHVFKKLEKVLEDKFTLNFTNESYGGTRGYFNILYGNLLLNGKNYSLNFHEDNIILKVNQKNQFEFTVIDLN